MAYSELVKNFNRVRDYMREFYVYGFKSRDEYKGKSTRSYDDEKRRIESWLGDFMSFHQNSEGKNVFLSIDSRLIAHNPLYRAWKTKSFTDGEITLHFLIFDILYDESVELTLSQIIDEIEGRLSVLENARLFDESTVRKKLKEYTDEGLLIGIREGKTVHYKRSSNIALIDDDILDFFSEVLPCGVVGSYISDKNETHEEVFKFKHHYITSGLDSEILFNIFQALREKRIISLKMQKKEILYIPLKIMVSVQNGRQYLMGYNFDSKRISALRLDRIIEVKSGEVCNDFDSYQKKLEKMLPFIWGVSTQSCYGNRIEHIDFTVSYSDGEEFIPARLEREKRNGTVEYIDKNKCKFSIDVYDSEELIPWIRTFISRILDINFSNKVLEERFKTDLNQMYSMYLDEE